MRALIYSPYWQTLGGGELFAAMVGQVLVRSGYRLEMVSDQDDLCHQINFRFGLDLAGVKIIPKVTGGKTSRGSGYDVVFWVSDGSIPGLNGKHNLVLCQVPFKGLRENRLKRWWKKRRIDRFICYSRFVKEVIDKTYGITAQVVYPGVKAVRPLAKENLILTVGRFDNWLHSKRQDVLIEAFMGGQFKGWKLVVAGGSLDGEMTVKKLEAMIGKEAIKVVVNPNHADLVRLYGQAKIYWHAAGYGQDLSLHPEKAEHFGITTVEAMSAGATPVVFDGGGQTEIVEQGLNGYRWQTPSELIELTSRLINDPTELDRLRQAAQTRAAVFSQERFEDEITKLLC